MIDLDPITPGEAVGLYLDYRREDVRESTIEAHGYRLNQFVEWCDREGIENLNDLSGRDVHRYRIDRRDDDGLKPASLKGNISTLRVFLQYAAGIEAVDPALPEKIEVPTLSEEDAKRDDEIPPERALKILAYLDRYHYASRRHALFATGFHTGARLGGLRALDVDDVDLDDRALEFCHRPETGTPLKNGRAGERFVAIGESVARVLDEYQQHRRVDRDDEFGRDPLFTSTQGRYSKTGIRETFYRATRPCMIGRCPHDEDPDTCRAMEKRTASLCPSSRSPHVLRSGSITWQLDSGIPTEVVAERVNATPDVIQRHYDRRTQREKMEQRRQHVGRLDDV